jgi:hypothetical protein
MPSNIILECAQSKGVSTSNSEWVSTFKDPVALDKGDIIQLKQALLNTKTVSSGGIDFSTDQTVSITVAYYDHAFGAQNDGARKTLPYGKNKLANSGGDFNAVYSEMFDDIQPAPTNNDQPYGYFLLREGGTETDNLITRTISITLGAGTYDPNGLAELITEKMVEQLDSSLLGGPDDRGFVVDPQGIIGSRCDCQSRQSKCFYFIWV